MACVADQIVASPYAVVGSVGVMALIPDVTDFMRTHGVKVNEFTAGKFKQTVVCVRFCLNHM